MVLRVFNALLAIDLCLPFLDILERGETYRFFLGNTTRYGVCPINSFERSNMTLEIHWRRKQQQKDGQGGSSAKRNRNKVKDVQGQERMFCLRQALFSLDQ